MNILYAQSTLGEVFAVVELGLSGSTSEKTNPDGTKTVIYKGELRGVEFTSFNCSPTHVILMFFTLGTKEIKPLSGRSRQIAEYLLICLMEKIVRNYFRSIACLQ